jgi:hypothetical protein
MRAPGGLPKLTCSCQCGGHDLADAGISGRSPYRGRTRARPSGSRTSINTVRPAVIGSRGPASPPRRVPVRTGALRTRGAVAPGPRPGPWRRRRRRAAVDLPGARHSAEARQGTQDPHSPVHEAAPGRAQASPPAYGEPDRVPGVPVQDRHGAPAFDAADGDSARIRRDSHGKRMRRGQLEPCACGKLHGENDGLLGTPLDPDEYDYREQALALIFFPYLVDRLWAELPALRRLEDPVRRRGRDATPSRHTCALRRARHSQPRLDATGRGGHVPPSVVATLRHHGLHRRPTTRVGQGGAFGPVTEISGCDVCCDAIADHVLVR